MWHHGIHSLKVLRHHSSTSLEHMFAIIYAIIRPLLEARSISKDTWIECLGDLSLHRLMLQ